MPAWCCFENLAGELLWGSRLACGLLSAPGERMQDESSRAHHPGRLESTLTFAPDGVATARRDAIPSRSQGCHETASMKSSGAELLHAPCCCRKKAACKARAPEELTSKIFKTRPDRPRQTIARESETISQGSETHQTDRPSHHTHSISRSTHS